MESGHVQHQPAGPAGIAVPAELRVYLIAHVAVVVCVEIVPDADADFSNGYALRQDVVIVEGEQRPAALRPFPDLQHNVPAVNSIEAVLKREHRLFPAVILGEAERHPQDAHNQR